MRHRALLAGFVSGYLVTSFFSINFPPVWFWIASGGFFILSCVCYLYWRRLNEDIYDF